MSNGNATYAERNAITVNIGEERFLEYCAAKGVTVRRLGFDEKHGKVARFFDLPDAVRLLPDFLVESENSVYLVEVKGSANFKQRDYQRIDWMTEQFVNDRTELWFVFALPNGRVWLRPGQVKHLYETSVKEATWPDGVTYRTLDFSQLKLERG